MKRKPKPKGVTTPELAAELGCSVWSIYRLREQGVLQEGKHWWIINPLSSRPSYRWNLKRCLKTIGGGQDANG